MLTLVKIRKKYLSRNKFHKYIAIFIYLIIPPILFLSLLIGFQGTSKYNQSNNSGNKIEENINLLHNENFDEFHNKLSIVTQNKEDCDIISNLVYKNKSLSLRCENKESDITGTSKNIIKIINNNGKYNIEFIEIKDNNNYSELEDLIFDSFLFKYEEYADPFYNDDLNSGYDYNNYHYESFLKLQSLLAQFLILKEKGNINKNIILNLGKNAYPPDGGNYYNSVVMGPITFLSMAICLYFSMTTYFFNMRMIDEKEKKLTLFLERKGISKIVYYFSWLISFIILAIVPLLFSFIAYIFRNSLLFFINLLLFIFSLFSYTYFLYVCISTSKTASIIIIFLNSISAILGSFMSFPQCLKISKVISAFFPQINFYLCSNAINKLNTFYELTWDKLWLKANRFSFMETIIMYFVEIIFYSLLSLFIEKYKNSGLSFFLFMKSLFSNISRNIQNNRSEIIEYAENIPYVRHFQELTTINQQKKAQNDYLSIVNVTKNFDTFKAVDNFNCDLFENEIFCLLGHNGAGKSTLINMISGIYAPNQGDIFYKGRSLVTNKDYLFKNIDICQQEDIFFDYLTVADHLKYICEIKGGNTKIEEINELMIKIGLDKKSKSLCNNLSRGEKRKLCTALSLIGNSNIILLDEPTNGMDPISKKSFWDFIKKYKKNKIILITTHSLDEAEYLGDRIGIMSDGHFICCGTSSFLKSKYPCGFNINLLIDSKRFSDNMKQIIFDKVKTFDPQAEIKLACKSILSINIQSNNENVGEIFRYIEESKKEFGIEDYTVASTSLEDVFLNINKKSNLNIMECIKQEDNNNIINNEQHIIEQKNIIATNYCTQLTSQLYKNYLSIKRNKLIVLLEYLSGLGITYILAFFFTDFINEKSQLDLVKLLEENKIYYYEPDSMENYLKNSYVYDSRKSITLQKLSSEPEGLEDLIKISYDESFVNIAEASISLKKGDNNITAYASQLNHGYLFANTMFIVSAFLKSEYNIDAVILSKMELRNEIKSYVKRNTIMGEKNIILVFICIGSVFGYVIYLGGLINEKIKERKSNIKHLLYLSGSNSWSYWLSFFIIDFIKLIVYTILFIIPFYYIGSSGGYYFLLNMLIINVSSLIFIYFVSFFGSNADSGVKFLFIIIPLIFIIVLICFSIVILIISSLIGYVLEYILDSFSESYTFTIFDITPITSMILSFCRILYSLMDYPETQLYKYSPGAFLATSYIIQFVNLIFYGILFILMEAGYFRKLPNCLKFKCCKCKKKFIFSKEEISDDFLIYNNANNPALLFNQLTNNFQNQSNNNQNNIMNAQIFGSNNNNIDNINTNSDSKLVINNSFNNMSQPLLDNINNSMNNNIDNDLALQDSNITHKERKEISYINQEKENLSTKKDLTIRIEGLQKTFFFCCKKNVRIINNLYLGLEPNEKFGLLGFNGSGKTTTFKIITNEILYDHGKITLFGCDNQKEFERIKARIGYCPQNDPLFEYMKVREILEFYSFLKKCNIPYQTICEKFGLDKYLDTYCINLSGGNKRKLIFAIAIMNKPSLLLLDEPSTGVDPESRRYMLKSINELSLSGHKYNMILATHYMDEAEILCDRVSWLKNGNFVCIGNPEKLKIQYNIGYKLHIKFDDNILKLNENYQKNNIQEAFQIICKLIIGFSDYSIYLLNNPVLEPFIRALIEFVNKIKDNTKKIILVEIEKDLSFKLILSILQEKKCNLFSEIFSIKNNNKHISELLISSESLENILTSFC